MKTRLLDISEPFSEFGGGVPCTVFVGHSPGQVFSGGAVLGAVVYLDMHYCYSTYHFEPVLGFCVSSVKHGLPCGCVSVNPVAAGRTMFSVLTMTH